MPDIIRINRFGLDTLHEGVTTVYYDEAINGERSGNLTPFYHTEGKQIISTTQEYDVSKKASAQVQDANLTSENIVRGAVILGVSGTYDGIIPSGSALLSENRTYDVASLASVTVDVPVPQPSGTLTISANGIYTYEQLASYATIIISVPSSVPEGPTVSNNTLAFNDNTILSNNTIILDTDASVSESNIIFNN